jgi:hypothetical protein
MVEQKPSKLTTRVRFSSPASQQTSCKSAHWALSTASGTRGSLPTFYPLPRNLGASGDDCVSHWCPVGQLALGVKVRVPIHHLDRGMAHLPTHFLWQPPLVEASSPKVEHLVSTRCDVEEFSRVRVRGLARHLGRSSLPLWWLKIIWQGPLRGQEPNPGMARVPTRRLVEASARPLCLAE